MSRWVGTALLILALLLLGGCTAALEAPLPGGAARRPAPTAYIFDVLIDEVPSFGGDLLVTFETRTAEGCRRARRVIVSELRKLTVRASAGECFAVSDLELPR